MHPRSLFSLAERLSKGGDPLEILAATVEFERFRPILTRGLGYSDGAKGGRPPFDPVAMFKVLVVQAQHNLSDARMEFMIRDRLSWMRFFGFDLGGAMPDENTIRHYRNRLTTSGTLEALMQAFEQQLREAGYLATSAVGIPASCSFNIPIICSSLNMLRFMRPTPCMSDSTHFWSHFRGARQTQGARCRFPDSAERCLAYRNLRLWQAAHSSGKRTGNQAHASLPHQFHPAILRPALRRIIAGNRLGASFAAGDETRGGNSISRNKRIAHGVGP